MTMCSRDIAGFNLAGLFVLALICARGSQAAPSWCQNHRYCTIWEHYINSGYTVLLGVYNECECASQAQCGSSPKIYSASSYLGSSLRIVGGSEAAECEFPWMAIIRDDIGRICAGSLIDNRHVITAGHCVERGLQRARYMRVGLGSSDRRESGRMQYIQADRVFRHPRYSTNNNDIAVIRLARAVSYTSCIQPICLATRPVAIPVGTVCLTSGWGILREGQFQAPDRLQAVKVPVVSNAQCSRSYSNIDRNKICAGFPEGGKDACQGDSGGPLACAFGRQWLMVGAVSYGMGCARPGYPGVYTYLPNYYSWIDRVRRA